MNTLPLRICLIEDDELMGEALCERFDMDSLDHDWHKSGKEALMAMRRRHYSVVVSDIRLPDMSGEDIFLQLRQAEKDTPPFLFMTGYGALDQAVRLLKLGAADYLAKPLDVDVLMRRIRELSIPSGIALPDGFTLGVSASMRRIEQMLGRLADSDGTVLITGESGVGKEQVARRLHELGTGKPDRPFIAVNCGAIPETLLESELFGFEKGAFTGATRERHGYFEQANGGTLFLDEVGDMPLVMQVKLLRAIQERTVTRVGGETPIQIKVRLICATHEDLRQLVERARFREDLYYRINVIHLRIPPLRERPEDILWLVRHFVKEQSVKKNGAPFSITVAGERILLSHPWPGNIRELKHCIERACILTDRPELGPDILLEDALSPMPATAYPTEDTLVTYMATCEKRYVEQQLRDHAWRIGGTAQSLGISRKNLWEKMRKHGIEAPNDSG